MVHAISVILHSLSLIQFPVGRYSIPDSPAVMIHSTSTEPTTPVVIRDCNFTSNYGHALYVYGSTVQFSGSVTYSYIHFIHNIGYEGAAMYLDKGTTLQFEYSIIHNYREQQSRLHRRSNTNCWHGF